MADKQEAINQAKDAAANSVFMLTGTKAQATALKKSALQGAKAAVAVRKSALLVASKLSTLQSTLEKIKGILASGGEAPSKLAQISTAISAGGNAFKEEEAKQEGANKPKALDLIQNGANKVADAVPGIAAFAMALPLLASPEIRDMLMGFFDGFMQGLGFSKESLDKLKLGLSIAGGILAAYFSMKVISSVMDAFNMMKKLAEAVGLVGEKTALEKDKIDVEKSATKKATGAAKDEIKGTKKAIKEGRKLGRLSFLKKFSLLSKVVGPKLLKLGANFLKALPGIGTILGIGFLIWDIFDIGKDIYDMFTGDPDEKENEEPEPEDKPEPAATVSPKPNAPAEATSKPAAASSAPATTPVTTSEPPAAKKAEEAVQTSSNVGIQLKESSERVEQAETDLRREGGDVNITVVDASTTVVNAEKKKPQAYSGPVYSTTVGA